MGIKRKSRGRSDFSSGLIEEDGAGKRTRTVDSYLGKVALYQLSYARISKFLAPLLCFSGKAGLK